MEGKGQAGVDGIGDSYGGKRAGAKRTRGHNCAKLCLIPLGPVRAKQTIGFLGTFPPDFQAGHGTLHKQSFAKIRRATNSTMSEETPGTPRGSVPDTQLGESTAQERKRRLEQDAQQANSKGSKKKHKKIVFDSDEGNTPGNTPERPYRRLVNDFNDPNWDSSPEKEYVA